MTKILIGKSEEQEISLELSIANRHGLVSGATGTGKTATLQALAQQFSNQGVPVFTADIKGDIAGLSQTGENQKIIDRYKKLNIEYTPEAASVIFYDLFGITGHPIRATIQKLGSLLLSKVLDLNETQTGVVEIAFKISQDQDLKITDLNDFKEILKYISENSEEIQTKYGNVAKASIGAIQRAILQLDSSGGSTFFGEPSFDFNDLIKTKGGKGFISILDARKLILDSRLYSTFLLWLLSELFENLPEIGDLEKPKMVFFFDEAHLLFENASDQLLEKIELVVRLIRSKGVGIYFVTQSPSDIPDKILQQLGNRIQHAIRGLTPQQKKLISSVAESYVTNPKFNTEDEIPNLGIGEALVSTLNTSGEPSMVEKTLILPPPSRLGSISDEERKMVINKSPIMDKYEERLKNDPIKMTSSNSKIKKEGQGMFSMFLKSIMRNIASQAGRIIVNQIKKSLFKGKL